MMPLEVLGGVGADVTMFCVFLSGAGLQAARATRASATAPTANALRRLARDGKRGSRMWWVPS